MTGEPTSTDRAFGLVVRFTARPGAEAALERALRQVDRALRGAAGCRLHVVARSVSDPGQFWVTELFDDRAAHRRAVAAPPLRRLADLIGTLLAVEPERHETEPLSGPPTG